VEFSAKLRIEPYVSGHSMEGSTPREIKAHSLLAQKASSRSDKNLGEMDAFGLKTSVCPTENERNTVV
jgi:hypothetical protein